VSASDSLFAEYRACVAMGLDIEEYFKKERHMRSLIVGGYIADSAINSMRQHDLAREREQESKRNRNKKH